MSSSAALLERRQASVPRGISTATKVFADRAQNVEIWDVEGRRYIDFAAGIAVLNVGHRHPKVMAAVQNQLERFTHTAFQVMAYEPYVSLAERLNALAPFSAPARTLLFTTGAEAVENAAKIARYATGRSALVAFSGAFHGRSLLALALTGKTNPYKAGFGPMPPEVFHIPFPSEGGSVSVSDSLASLERLFSADVHPERIAAIFVEPVQGEGGFNVAPVELLRGLREVCDRHGILLIADEVQSGFGRTGKMFAIEHSGVEPDLVTVAKALGGGFPISGVIGRDNVMSAVDPGGLGGTYGGGPVACAAALAVLDVIEEEGLVERAGAIGARMSARIAAFAARNDLTRISLPRGLGAMVAFDVAPESVSAETGGALAARAVYHALKEGLIVLTCGTDGQAIRLLPPLTASDAILDEGLDKLERALRSVAQRANS